MIVGEKFMRVSNRIKHIIEMCNYDDVIIDIGCDHGYISMELIKNCKCRKVYAVDINEEPLNVAKKNINLGNFDGNIECVLSNGFRFLNKSLNDSVSAVIAGIGGVTISQILQQDLDKVNNMNYALIQPSIYSKYIRKFIINKKIYIEKEDVVFSNGIYYEYILIFPKQQAILNQEYEKILLKFEYDLPICVINNENGSYNEFINYKINKFKMIVSKIQKESYKNRKKCIEFEEKILMLRKFLK